VHSNLHFSPLTLSLYLFMYRYIFIHLSHSLRTSPAPFPPSPFLPPSQVGDIASAVRIQQLELELSSLREATSALQSDLHSRISDLESSLQVAREDQYRAKATSDGDCRCVLCSADNIEAVTL
jgi:hypothetical protein